MNSKLQRDLESLIADLIDNRLNDDRREELNFLLRDNEQCRRHFNKVMDVQAGMVQLAEQSDMHSSEYVPIHDPILKSQVADIPVVKSFSNVRSKNAIRIGWSVTFAVLAATLLIAFGLTKNLLKPTEISTYEADRTAGLPERSEMGGNLTPADRSVIVAGASSAEYFDGGPAEQGEVLVVKHEYVLLSGMLKIAFPTGAEAIVEGPSVFTVQDSDRLLVKMGRCSVYAPPGAEGFRVDTPQTEVIDLGTRFSLEVNEVGRTDVQVLEGAAEVYAATKGPVSARGDSEEQKKLHLTNGQAGRFGDDLQSFGEIIRFEPSTYITDLPDQVIKYKCAESEGPYSRLQSITVQRGNGQIEYDVGQLIGIDVIHFVAQKNRLNVATVHSAGPKVQDLLGADHSLATGMINPGGAAIALKSDPILNRDAENVEPDSTPGLAFRFAKPIKNDPGPDMVVFDLQSKVDSPTGDGFHLSPVHFSEGLRSHTVKQYDINMKSSRAIPIAPFDLLSFGQGKNLLQFELKQANSHHKPTLQFYGLAVGVDFSDLGYKPGSFVDTLFLQDDDDEERQIDPVFIAGFPDLLMEN